METFLEILREVLKGIARESSTHVIRKDVLEHKKSPNAVECKKGGSRATK